MLRSLFRLIIISNIMMMSMVMVNGDDVDCSALPLDVVFIQDSTSSYEDDLDTMVSQIPGMIDSILESNPGSMFALIDFRDIDSSAIYCVNTSLSFTDDKDKIQQYYKNIGTYDGGDGPEDPLYATLVTQQYKTVYNWRPIGKTGAGARLFIIVTDWPGHYNGDHTVNSALTGLPDFKRVDQTDPNAGCLKTQYPRMNDFYAGMQAEDYQFLTVLLPPSTPPSNVSWWQDVSTTLGQTKDFVIQLADGSTDFMEKVLEAISMATSQACKEQSATTTTTTTKPTTSKTTTSYVPPSPYTGPTNPPATLPPMPTGGGGTLPPGPPVTLPPGTLAPGPTETLPPGTLAPGPPAVGTTQTENGKPETAAPAPVFC